MIEVRSLKTSDLKRLHESYDAMRSDKHFIDLYWLGFKNTSPRWLFAQIALFGSTIPFLRYLLRRIYFRSVIFSVIATEQGRILGHCFCLLRDRVPNGGFVAEYGIWVSESSRGLGLGRRLSESIIELVKNERYVSSIKLFVWENNKGAINLYKSLGFKQTDLLKSDKVFKGVSYDSLEMRMNIKDKETGKLKALFIANGIDDNKPGIAGGETRFMEIARGWALRGVEVHLLGGRGGYEIARNFDLNPIMHHLRSVRNLTRMGFFYKLLYSVFLPKELLEEKFDIIYSTNEQLYDTLPGFILKIKNRRSTKWAVVVHWLPPFKWWGRKSSKFLNSLLFLISERTSLYLACFFSDSILAVSDSTKKQVAQDPVSKFFMKKTHAVKCGVNYRIMREISSKVTYKKHDAVFLKRLQAVKGIFDLIEVWEMVVKALPRATLAIIGAGIDGEEARKRVRDKGLEKNVSFKGAIYDMKTKIEELASSKLFVLPTYEENWAISIGEAMAAGVPVFAYSLPELDEVWGDNYVHIPVGAKAILAEKIIEALQNESILAEISGKALDFVQRYDWDSISGEELNFVYGNFFDKQRLEYR